MRNYLSKFPSNLLSLILIISLVIILVATVVVDKVLATSKVKIEQNLSDLFNRYVQIKSINFLPPNFLILKSVSIHDSAVSSRERPLFFAENAKYIFSLPAFIFKGEMRASNIYLNSPSVDIATCARFIKDNSEILNKINSFKPGYSLNLKIKRARLGLNHKIRGIENIFFDAILKIGPKRNILSSGNIDFDNFPNKNSLCYNLKGILGEGDFNIDNLELKRGNFYLKLWGDLKKNTLRFNGFSSLSGFFEDSSSQKPILILNQNFRILLSKILRRPYLITIAQESFSNLNIFDIDCLIKFSPEKIDLENFNFSLNNVPFKLKGSLNLMTPFSLVLGLSNFADQPERSRALNPERFDLNISASLENGKLSGGFRSEFMKKNNSQKFEINFSNLKLYLVFDNNLKLNFDNLVLTYSAGGNPYNINLNNFTFKFDIKNKSFRVNSKVYDGILIGTGYLDTEGIKIKCQSDLRIKGVSVHKFGSLSTYLSNVHGRLSTKIYFRNLPRPNIEGEIVIHNGYLENFEFFTWLADFFQIPGLKRIGFNRVSAYFLVSEEISKLESIQLDSNEVILNGFFNLYANDLVTSKLSLGISRDLLETSSKFKPLLKLLNKELEFLNFDFQLSGLFQTMNFKWLESNFKQKLQELLPKRIEKELEKEIERLTQPSAATEN